MTLEDLYHAQETAKKKLAEERERGSQEKATEPATASSSLVDLRHWQQAHMTELFIGDLAIEIAKLDAQAKDLAMLDNGSSSSAIRALLIESATLKKVIDYARRNDTNTSY